jgi:DNA-binding XRE family transcriptional regulator
MSLCERCSSGNRVGQNRYRIRTVPLKKVELSRLGRRIRRARKLLGFSQQGFAAKCGLERRYLRGLERGNRNVSFAVLCTICEVLTCDIAAVSKGIPHL